MKTEPKFKVGDRVKCVDNHAPKSISGHPDLALGKEYTISCVEKFAGDIFVGVDTDHTALYYEERFVKVEPTIPIVSVSDNIELIRKLAELVP